MASSTSGNRQYGVVIAKTRDDAPLEVSEGLEIPTHDAIAFTYDGERTDPSTVTYYRGGTGGTVVATVTMTYDASDRLLTLTRAIGGA